MATQPSQDWILYGAPGWGSAIVEAVLTIADLPFLSVDVSGFDKPGQQRQRLLELNDLAQVPTLQLPNGEVLTESAAILLYVAELRPDAGLMPLPGHPDRARFLRLLVWLVAAVYPTFTYGDYPERWTPAAPEALRAATDRTREELWLGLERKIAPEPWLLGRTFSALDLYVAVMSRWRPGPDWFAANCPGITSSANAAREIPALRAVWARNFSAH